MILFVQPEGAGLPSFDSASLAAISYLTIVAPDSFSIDRSASGPSLPTGQLPTLHDPASNSWISDFDEIVAYLRQAGLDADHSLSAEASADAFAYSYLFVHKARDLTSLSLYVDEENYSTFTRKELGLKLPFPRNYTTPNDRHNRALQRMRDLGLDFETDKIPQGLFGDKKKAALRQQARMIRVQRLADNLYTISESKLSKSQFLLGNKATSIDCLAFGQLALHLFPPVPNNFLAKTLKQSYPRTWKYIVDFRTEIFEHGSLNIVPVSAFSTAALLQSIWRELAGPAKITKEDTEGSAEKSELVRRQWRSKAAFVTGAVALLIGFVLTNNMITFDIEESVEADDFMSSAAYNVPTDDISESDPGDEDADEVEEVD